VFPILIDFGTVTLPLVGEVHLFLPTYGFLFASAVLLAWFWFQSRARIVGVPDDHSFNMSFYSVLAGVAGAKLLLILVDWRDYLRHPAEILGTLRAGGVLLGGVLAGAVTFTYYVRKHELPFLKLVDAAAAPLALAQSIGRLGCFSAGCCWGVETSSSAALAVTFTDPVAHQQTGVPLGIPLVPVQLIQSLHDMALCLFLTLLWRRRPRPDGTVFWTYVLLYSIGRGTIELWRGDAGRGLYFGGLLSTSQLLGIAGILLAVVMLVRGGLQRRASAAR
jgi:phosphatidylglycerol:prolipoprotein diacylglycerol transferase